MKQGNTAYPSQKKKKLYNTAPLLCRPSKKAQPLQARTGQVPDGNPTGFQLARTRSGSGPFVDKGMVGWAA